MNLYNPGSMGIIYEDNTAAISFNNEKCSNEVEKFIGDYMKSEGEIK